MKNHSRNLHALLCGIFCLNLVCVACCDVSFGQNFLQIVMHILQKVFFKHALKKRATEQKRVTGHGANSKRKGLITEERGLFLEKEVKVQENKMGVTKISSVMYGTI